jgi:hypothetical protein
MIVGRQEEPSARTDRSAPPTVLQLRGLVADNLLAFLALLGLMRALETIRPGHRPRTRWSGPPWRAQLYCDAKVDEEVIAGAADAGVVALGQAHRFDGHKNIDFTGQEFRAFAQRAAEAARPADRSAADLAAALASDVNLRRDGARVEGNALCAIYGQGHQSFLERLEKLGRAELKANEGALKIAQAVFETWRYEDLAETFRWDPEEDRRYALGFADPSGQKIRTVAGANRLAAIGFSVFACAPSSGGLQTLAVRRARRAVAVTWPIWTVPLALPALRALLTHPALLDEEPSPEALSPYGISELMRARRSQTGKYFSFEPARALWGR